LSGNGCSCVVISATTQKSRAQLAGGVQDLLGRRRIEGEDEVAQGDRGEHGVDRELVRAAVRADDDALYAAPVVLDGDAALIQLDRHAARFHVGGELLHIWPRPSRGYRNFSISVVICFRCKPSTLRRACLKEKSLVRCAAHCPQISEPGDSPRFVPSRSSPIAELT
jgi:hypothetical protein